MELEYELTWMGEHYSFYKRIVHEVPQGLCLSVTDPSRGLRNGENVLIP